MTWRPRPRYCQSSRRSRVRSRPSSPRRGGGPRRALVRNPEQLRGLAEEYVRDLALTPELGALEDPIRYALEAGKRVRAVLCLATAEAAGTEPETALPAAASLELVHAFSLVHDDLPALDDDEERRGRPSTWARYGEAVAILAGDALLAEAFRLALTYSSPAVARELAQATLGMIGGQYLDITDTAPDEATLHRLKTGCLFAASVGLGLWVAEVPERDQAPWRAFGDELGLLFQIVDDILDGDGYVLSHGADGARALADEAAKRARERLNAIPADTSILADIVEVLATRTA
ncbi:MAG: polyprenyl synthetase family protein [Actinobacteria bacterium]|nr:MAG: polyprenyl synthetase family protein [Actinomycetota bacterium]